MMGYIMKNRHTAMGSDTRYTDIASSAEASPGAARPRAMPATMHSPTHTVR